MQSFGKWQRQHPAGIFFFQQSFDHPLTKRLDVLAHLADLIHRTERSVPGDHDFKGGFFKLLQLADPAEWLAARHKRVCTEKADISQEDDGFPVDLHHAVTAGVRGGAGVKGHRALFPFENQVRTEGYIGQARSQPGKLFKGAAVAPQTPLDHKDAGFILFGFKKLIIQRDRIPVCLFQGHDILELLDLFLHPTVGSRRGINPDIFGEFLVSHPVVGMLVADDDQGDRLPGQFPL